MWSGLYKGVVLSTQDPASLSRVRLQVPQVSGSSATDWVPPAQAGGALPSVGSQVWVMYQGGDASYPVYVPPIPAPPSITDMHGILVSSTVTASYVGQVRYNPTSAVLEVWNGTAWFPYAQSLFVRKTSDTPITNSTTYAQDPHLSLSLAANAVYEVHCFLILNTPSGAGFNFHMVAPSGATIRVAPWGESGSYTSDTASIRTGISSGSGFALTGGTSNDTSLRPVALVRTVNAGTLYVEWSQNVANTTSTFLRAESFMRADRMG